MKKRIFAFLCAMLMLAGCTLPTLAVCTQQPMAIIVEPLEPTQPQQTAGQKIHDVLVNFLIHVQKYLVLIILIVILAAIVIAITISEKKLEKERQEKMPPKKHKKNK